MQRIIPAEYVLTSEAIAEMQQGDAEWLRLKDLRDQSGRQHGAEWTAMGNRAAELQAVLLDNVASDRPPAFIVKPTDTGAWQALSLPRDYWADVAPASVALVKGSVVAGKLHDNDIRRFEGDALCFRRADWSAWLAVATAKQERWTAPQAAVWIRTRDRVAAQGLDDRERKCLVLAAMAIEDDTEGKGAVAASECLRVALQRGRLSATGRRAQLEWVDGTDKLQPWILETDDERIPEEFWKEGSFSPSIGDEGDSAAAPGERERWLGVTVMANDCTGLWPHPSSFLTQKQKPIAAALADLMTEPAERLGWLLTRPDVIVTHLNDARERVLMDLGLFHTSSFTIDTAANSLSADGLRWVSVMIGLAPAQEALPADSALAQPIDQVQGQPERDHEREVPKAKTPPQPSPDRMQEWYRLERVAKHDAQNPPPSRTDDQKAARDYFKMGGLNSLVRQARAAEAPWHWKRGGSRGRKAAELRARQEAQRTQLAR
jgi:hypothetical protein